MEIKKGTNRFYIGDSENAAIAEITFVPKGASVIEVDHTWVSPELRGQGIAKLLVDRVVSWAREENLKIIPVCPYVKTQMERNQEYHDLLLVSDAS